MSKQSLLARPPRTTVTHTPFGGPNAKHLSTARTTTTPLPRLVRPEKWGQVGRGSITHRNINVKIIWVLCHRYEEQGTTMRRVEYRMFILLHSERRPLKSGEGVSVKKGRFVAVLRSALMEKRIWTPGRIFALQSLCPACARDVWNGRANGQTLTSDAITFLTGRGREGRPRPSARMKYFAEEWSL